MLRDFISIRRTSIKHLAIYLYTRLVVRLSCYQLIAELSVASDEGELLRAGLVEMKKPGQRNREE